MTTIDSPAPRVAFVTLGCGRNEVDSEQAAGALAAAGYRLVDEPEQADCILVNTCAFIEPAREDSVQTVLAACDVPGAKVVVMGCMAERYQGELAEAIPEAAAVVGFAGYANLPVIVASALAIPTLAAPTPLSAHIGAAPSPTTATFPIRTVP